MKLRRVLLLATAITAVLAVLSACAPVPPAPFKDADNGSPTDHGWFEGGKIWRGSFPDPHVIRVGSTYYAYSTATAGRALPVFTSTDLKTWTIHSRWSKAGPPGTRGYDVNTDPAIPAEIRAAATAPWTKYDQNDAMVRTARWAAPKQDGPFIDRVIWAPGVIQIGSTWYAYYAVRTGPDPQTPGGGFGRFCISVATSTSPLGPFRDYSTGPVQCQSVATDPAGSIDPYPYRDPSGRLFLLWKASGKIGASESSLQAVELGTNGRPKPGAPVVKLLSTSRTYGWEGSTIENPAMINYRGTTYLFYSANWFGTTDTAGHSPYATGYAICPSGPLKPCTRPTPKTPLLSSTATEYGQGGASAFLDTSGALRLAYHYYWPGENRNGGHVRRLQIGRLVQNPDKTLRVG